jgi:acyl-CoA thioesterase I
MRLERSLKLLFALLSMVLAGCGGGGGGEGDPAPSSEQPPAPLRFVAIGASETIGRDASSGNGFLDLVRRELEAEGIPVEFVNLGISGAEADIVIDRELTPALRAQPDLVTVFVGANDVVQGRSLGAFSSQLDTILRRLAESTDAEVAVATIFDLTRLPTFRRNPDRDVTPQRVAAFNDEIRRATAAYGYTLIELVSFPAERNTVGDGFHQNDEGHRLLAAEVLPTIRELAR